MSEEKGVKPLNDSEVSPTDRTTAFEHLVDTVQVRRRGGYLVASVGWTGLAYRLLSVLLGFLISGLVWAGLTVAGVLVDESFLAGVRSVCRIVAPEASSAVEEYRRFPLLEDDRRRDLQTHWKQLLAEVQLEQSTYPPRLVRILRDLTLADVGRIDRIAPYVVGGAILRNNDNDTGHDIPLLTFMDFARLKTIGLLEQGQFGQRALAKPQNGQPATRLLRGTTLALRVTASDPSTDLEIPITGLTEEGKLIVQLLDRPTSLSALCASAVRLKEAKLKVQIGASFEPSEDAWSNPSSVRDVTTFCLPSGS